MTVSDTESVAVDLTDVDLVSVDFHSGDPFPVYDLLRETAPVYRDERNDIYALTRYDDVVAVSRDPETFSSEPGSRLNDEGNIPSMINLDDPRHLRQRRLVNRGFTPRRINELEDHIRALVTRLIDAVIPDGASAGSCEFVEAFAAPLPMTLIGEMLGFEPADHMRLLEWADTFIAGADRADIPPGVIETFGLFAEYMFRVMGDKRTTPGDDLVSILVQAEPGGEKLSDEELLAEAVNLLVGGSESTRGALTGGMFELLARPDVWDALAADPSLVPNAVEEILRWTTPVVSMRRTTTRDVELRGVAIPKDSRVVLFYPAANRDPEVFADPHTFDVARQFASAPVTFGFGPHFCLGASLARLEARILFEELTRRVTDVRVPDGAEVKRKGTSFVWGISELPVEFTVR